MRIIAPLCLFVGVMVWAGTEYVGRGSSGIDVEAKSSACVVELDAGDTACLTVAAAVLSSADDVSHSDSPRTYYAGDAQTPQSNFRSGFDEEGLRGGNAEPVAEDASVSLVTSLNAVTEGGVSGDDEPQYIGEYIDPDGEDNGSVAGDDAPISIGEFIDPDGNLFFNTTGDDQVIGAFIDPDAG